MTRTLFDTVILSLFLHPDAKAPKGVTRCKARIERLIEELAEDGGKILIPTPVLGEFLTLPDAHLYLPELEGDAVFEIVSFDKLAAIEVAALMNRARDGRGKRGGAAGPWQKIKIDWQLVAIAKVHRADSIYTDDSDVTKLSAIANIPTCSVATLPLPPPEAQQLPLEGD